MHKSLSGQGSFRQRPDGRWEGRLTRERQGRRHRISVYGATAAEVQRKLNAKIQEEERGEPEPAASGRLTLGEFMAGWLEELKSSPRVRPSTWQTYANLIKVQIGPALGNVRLIKLTYEDLERFYGTMHRRHLSRNYIRVAHAVIHAALKAARRKRLITGDPAGLVDLKSLLPRERSQRRRALTLEELTTVLGLLEDHPQQAFFTTALLSGLRFGELAALRWQDVDLEAGSLTVERGLRRIKHSTADELGLEDVIRIGDPKSESSFRQVAVPAEVTEALRRHRTKQRERFLLYGRPWSDSELAFQNSRFHAVHQPDMNNAWHRIQDAAGIARDRHIPMHGTRNTFATLDGGARHERVTQGRLGHDPKNPAMTRMYQAVWDQAGNVRHIEDTLAQARAKAAKLAQ